MDQNLSYKIVCIIIRHIRAATQTFFRDIQIIGLENIPQDGPLIIYGNHNNQFVDALLLVSIVPRMVKLIAAAKSMRRPIIGHLGRMLGGIPVERPQDLKKAGAGYIESIFKGQVFGKNTLFTLECKVGDSLLIDENEFVIINIKSDTIIETSQKEEELKFGNHHYSILPKVDQSGMFSEVWNALKNNDCIGIFPEGGSHDRTSLLPLKAGICIMALGAISKYQTQINLVPCGFTYYKGYQFRSKVVIQFGPAYKVRQSILDEYQNNKRQAIQILLKEIEKRLKDVTLQTECYSDLCVIQLSKRIYIPDKLKLKPQEELDMNRSFANAFSKFSHFPAVQQLISDIKNYRQLLKRLGIEDYQVLKAERRPIRDILQLGYRLQLTTLCFAFALPGILLNGPLALILRYYSEKERRKALKGSKVKVLGKDVVASYKMLASFVMLPVSNIFYTYLLNYLLRKFKIRPQVVSKLTFVFFFLWPIYATAMIKSADELFRNFKTLKAKILFLFFSEKYRLLKDYRVDLQIRISKFVQDHNLVPQMKQKQVQQSESFETKFQYVFESLEDLGI